MVCCLRLQLSQYASIPAAVDASGFNKLDTGLYFDKTGWAFGYRLLGYRCTTYTTVLTTASDVLCQRGGADRMYLQLNWVAKNKGS